MSKVRVGPWLRLLALLGVGLGEFIALAIRDSVYYWIVAGIFGVSMITLGYFLETRLNEMLNK